MNGMTTQRYVRILLAIALSVSVVSASWAQGDEPERKMSAVAKLGAFAMFEVLTLFNSAITMGAPEVVGGVGLALTPLGLRGEDTAVDYTGMSLWATLCLYNLIAPSALDLSDDQVFAHNMVGWHVLAGGILIAAAVSDDPGPEPQPDGPVLGLVRTANGLGVGVSFSF